MFSRFADNLLKIADDVPTTCRKFTTDLPDMYKDGSKQIKVEVTVNKGEGPEGLQPSIFSEVIGASMDGPGGGVVLELPDNGKVNAADVLRFRI